MQYAKKAGYYMGTKYTLGISGEMGDKKPGGQGKWLFRCPLGSINAFTKQVLSHRLMYGNIKRLTNNISYRLNYSNGF